VKREALDRWLEESDQLLRDFSVSSYAMRWIPDPPKDETAPDTNWDRWGVPATNDGVAAG